MSSTALATPPTAITLERPHLTLHHLERSSSFTIIVALEEAFLLSPNSFTYEIKTYSRVGLFAPPELQTLTPLGKVPVLGVRQKDGSDKQILQTRIILRYIVKNFMGSAWEQETEEARERDLYWQEFVRDSFRQRMSSAMLFYGLPQVLPFGFREIALWLLSFLGSAFAKDVKACLKHMEDSFDPNIPDNEELYEGSGKTWLGGNNFGLSDLNAINTMDLVVQYKLGWNDEEYPRLKEWWTRLQNREAFKLARQKAGPWDLTDIFNKSSKKNTRSKND